MSTLHRDERSSTRSDRRLTITYYVEPQAMRRLTISVRSANAIVVGVGVSLLWTLGTIAYFIVTLSSGGPRNMAARPATEKISESQAEAITTVPQERMDHLAAVATPAVTAGKMPTAVTVAAAPVSVSAPTSAPAPAKAEAAPQKIDAAPAPLPAAKSSAPAPAAGEVANGIALERIKAAANGKALKTSVDIVNKGKDAAAGQVWGVATFAGEDGTKLDVIDRAGAGKTRYRAQRMSQKELAFDAPVGRAGRFVEVRIFASDASGGETSVTQPVP